MNRKQKRINVENILNDCVQRIIKLEVEIKKIKKSEEEEYEPLKFFMGGKYYKKSEDDDDRD